MRVRFSPAAFKKLKKKRLHSLMDKMRASEACDGGSIPPGDILVM